MNDGFAEKLNNWIGGRSFWITVFLIATMLLVTYIYRKKRFFERQFKQETGVNADIDEALFNRSKGNSYDTVRRVGSCIIVLTFVLLILAVNGINVSAPLAGLGILGTIVGLACQDVLKDTIMGLRIVKDEFFVIGDAVRINDVTGIVVDFNLRHTKVEDTKSHSVLCICNGAIVSFERLSHLLIIEIPVDDREPFSKAKNAIQHMCAKIWMIDGVENCYFKGMDRYTEEGIIYHIWVFAKVERQSEINYQSMRIVKETMDSEDLRLPANLVELMGEGIKGHRPERS